MENHEQKRKDADIKLETVRWTARKTKSTSTQRRLCLSDKWSKLLVLSRKPRSICSAELYMRLTLAMKRTLKI